MDHTTISLPELISNSDRQLYLLGYAEGTKRRYRLIWHRFSVYAAQNGQTYFSRDLGTSFLEDYYQIKSGMNLSGSQVFKVRTIAVLGEMLDRNCFFKCHHKKGSQSSPQFHDILNEYKNLQREKGLSERTICGKKIILIRFLNYLNEQNVTDIGRLTSLDVLSYLNTLEQFRTNTRSGILFCLRNFLFFLYSEGYLREPLNDLFPVIFSNKFERFPSHYSTDEVHAILCQVDRNTTVGRRDYLVLLLAVQLAMRAGDIRQLKFENIKWNRNTIEFVQQKTNAPLQLPVTEEFKYALADYMKNSRPKVDDPHIFVRHRAPFQPFTAQNTFYHVLNKYMTLAGTKFNGRKHGLHSMRHSSASNFLQNHTPYPVITGILGHENASTTKLYLRIDIQQLRTVALEVPNEQ